MPDKPPWFKCYPLEFVADGVVEAMTTEQVGAYWLLLCKAWFQEPSGSVPDDDVILAKWARLPAKKWAKIKAGVLAAFTLRGDRFHQKRMEKVYAEVAETFERQREGGRKGAARRWGSDTQCHTDGLPNGSPNGLVNGLPNATPMTHASESLSGSESESFFSGVGGAGEGTNGHGPAPPDFPLTAEGLAQAWAFAFRGSVRSHADPYKTAAEFREWIDGCGVRPEAIRDAIAAKRDRSEPVWDLKKRLIPKEKSGGKRESKRFRE